MSVYLCLCGRVRVSVGVYVSVSLARERAIKRPRTRSTAARQVSNAYERDLVRSNVSFGKSFFFLIQFANSWGFQPAATGEYFLEFRSLKVTCVLVSLSCPFSSNVSFVNTEYMKRWESLCSRVRVCARCACAWLVCPWLVCGRQRKTEIHVFDGLCMCVCA